MYKRAAVMTVLVLILVSVPVLSTFAEEPAPAPASAAALTEVQPAPVAPAALPVASIITPDTDIFRRSPVIDGIVDDGEWDVYYSHTSGDWQVATYADWDAKNLYVAAKSNKPIDLLNVLDANDDGWFHGDENFEFKALRAPDGAINLSVCRYESRNIKLPVATPVTAAEAALVDCKSSKGQDSFMIEMRVPISLIRGFKLADCKKIGFQINVKASPDESGWVPTAQVGDLRDCTLVTRKFATLKPLTLGFDLKDATIARGGELVGRFHMTSSGTETLDARSFVIAGEGKAGEFLSSEKIRIEGLPPKKHVTRDVRTVVPADMPTGCWALGAEVRSSNDTRLGAALISFEVVDPFEVELRLPTTDVRADVKDVTFQVVIKNNTRRPIRGKAKVTLPVGWELWKNADTREFAAGPLGSLSFVTFKAKPPLGEMGSVPVKAVVTAEGENRTAEGKFAVVNP